MLVGSVLWEAWVAGCAAQHAVAIVVTARTGRVVCHVTGGRSRRAGRQGGLQCLQHRYCNNAYSSGSAIGLCGCKASSSSVAVAEESRILEQLQQSLQSLAGTPFDMSLHNGGLQSWWSKAAVAATHRSVSNKSLPTCATHLGFVVQSTGLNFLTSSGSPVSATTTLMLFSTAGQRTMLSMNQVKKTRLAATGWHACDFVAR